MKAKKPIQTKFRMPLLNWVALKPSQITGTVFTELNDEKVLQVSGRDRACGASGASSPGMLPVGAGAGLSASLSPLLGRLSSPQR